MFDNLDNPGGADPNNDPNNPVNPDEWMNDEALNEEDPEFKPEENDKRIFKSLFNPLTPTVYDASWFDLDPKITTTFLDFMIECRRTPLVFCFIKTSLNNLHKRLINFEEIEKQWNDLNDKSIKQKQADVEKYIKEIQEKKDQGEEVEVDQEEIKRIMETPDENLPQLNDMKDKAKESTTNRHGENKTFLKEFRNTVKEKGIPVIKVKNDRHLDEALSNLKEKLTPYIKQRKNLIERQLVLSKLNYVQERKLKELECSDICRLSVYKNFSPMDPHKLVKKTNYPAIYRDRVYYFNSQEEKKKFCEEPLNYRSGKEFPLDVNLRKIVFVIGNLKSGKTTISKLLDETGFIRVSLKTAIYDLYEKRKKNPMLLHDSILKQELDNIIGEVITS